MHPERYGRLIERLHARDLDALALMPGPNLFYVTGLSFHLSERPIVALFLDEGPPAIILPELEAVKVGDEMVVFPYTDESGPDGAFQRACATLDLSAGTIGAEGLRIRLMEIRLLEQYSGGRLVMAEAMLNDFRAEKDEHELENMRSAIAITEAALRATRDRITVGMSEREIASMLRIELLRGGSDEMAFSPIVVAGSNAALPHATPSDRLIRAGETIIIDCGASFRGYAADITRTFVIDELEPDLAEVYGVVRAANAAARAAVGPGVLAEEIDRAARAVIEEAGYGDCFIHRTGHGLGLEIHEPPYIVMGNPEPLRPGMTFTIEPGIYLPERGGVRIEDDVLVTEEGAETMTSFTRKLTAVSM